MNKENKFLATAPAAEALGITPRIIGWVRSPLKDLENCPHWQDEGPEAELEILEEYAPALDSMQPGQKIVLLTWLHESSRNVLHRSKHNDPDEPPRGVFSSRSPVRPNPIGLHDISVLSIERGAGPALVRVQALEALDGTPILDIKTGREFFYGEDQSAMEHGRGLLTELCHRAAAKGLLPGASGNASLRMGGYAMLTPSGVPKERITDDGLVPVRISDGKKSSPGSRPSSEYALHLEIYKNQPKARAILHTHPAALTALGVRQPGKSLYERLDLPVFECAVLREKSATVSDFEPGTQEVAEATGKVAREKQVIWLEKHGLCVWGDSADEVLALSEECEHLARVALLAGR